MVRHPSKYNNMLFLLFVAALVIPFQSIMIPLVRVASWFHLTQSLPGLWVAYMGFGSSLTIFLYHGFIKSIPVEIEESATVDGSSPYGVFWRIVFPLLRPMTATIIILNSLWIWNDFLLPNLMLSEAQRTNSAVDLFVLRAVYQAMGFGAGWARHGHRADSDLFPDAAAPYHFRHYSWLCEGVVIGV